ncbi:hypothetical protein NCIMB2158_410025 [Tenacibaculum maritimum]|uniref:hypothetical protein n=1 Tax=Tenacibaculum maritimum TaxID=107401 RepID=UPI0012E54D04|nr:hypothetical protein [Tenacibaculum maritimum]CAA0223147.1 hypothetical protein NCIMB2158_410025 [Tenacibaculum maritimum]
MVDAHSPNNIKVAYNGTNPDKNGELDQRSTPNYWLDMDGNWFELKKGYDCRDILNLKQGGDTDALTTTKEPIYVTQNNKKVMRSMQLILKIMPLLKSPYNLQTNKKTNNTKTP